MKRQAVRPAPNAKLEASPPPADAFVSAEEIFNARTERLRREQLGALELTFTLRNICDAVGHGVSVDEFAADALQAVADQIEAVADQIEAEGHISHEEVGRWERLSSIAHRARFAALAVRKLDFATGRTGIGSRAEAAQ